ncbi:WD repeat-containing protein 61 [Mycena leptocephala]|nr:WD repeat-containing protein 61 [Mycena leptocephala]
MSLAFLHAHDCSEPHSDAVWGAAWTASDNVVSVSADGAIKQWASSSGQRHPPNAEFPPPHTLGLVSLSVSPDGTRALYNSIEGLTCLWDCRAGRSAAAWSVSLNPTSETYAATGGTGNVVIYSANPETFGQRVASLASGRSKYGMYCQHSPDGKRIALSTETGQIYIFDVEAQALTTTYTSHALSVRSLAWSATLAKRVGGQASRVHDVRTSAGDGASFTGHASWVLSVDISQDGRLGLSGSADKSIKIWDIGARAAVSTVQDTGEVWAVSWRPKPSAGGAGAFVSGGEDGLVRWWRGAGVAV